MLGRLTPGDPLKLPRAVLSALLGAMVGFFVAVVAEWPKAILGPRLDVVYGEAARGVVVSLSALVGLIARLRTPRGLRPGDRLG